MLLYMQDYVNLLVALGIKHFNSLLVKHRFLSQRSGVDSEKIKLPWKLL